MERYSIITERNPREIVLLRGRGCSWRRCRFCDYHLDFSTDEQENYRLNHKELAKVTGRYHKLEVINSGSFTDLDRDTLTLIKEICSRKEIGEIHFECHWTDRQAIKALRAAFTQAGISVKIKIGVETFDALFRESYLDKGITASDPSEIAADFDECCLLFGLPGQNSESMERDVETGLQYFERVCINIMVENGKPVKPDPAVIEVFLKELYPKYMGNPRIDILLDNTDFGVGGESHA